MPKAKSGEPGDTSEEDSDDDGRYKKKEEQIKKFSNKRQFTRQIKKKKYHSEHGAYKSKSWIM